MWPYLSAGLFGAAFMWTVTEALRPAGPRSKPAVAAMLSLLATAVIAGGACAGGVQ